MPGNLQSADQIKPTVETLGGLGDDGTFFDTTAFARVTEIRFRNVGRNTMQGPVVVNLDLSLYRTFRSMGQSRMQFRVDASNVNNTPHFANPNGNINSPPRGSRGTRRRDAVPPDVQRLAPGRIRIQHASQRFVAVRPTARRSRGRCDCRSTRSTLRLAGGTPNGGAIGRNQYAVGVTTSSNRKRKGSVTGAGNIRASLPRRRIRRDVEARTRNSTAPS